MVSNIQKIGTRWFFVGFCLLGCCSTLKPEDESFSFDRTNYTGNEIRVDGYYYEAFESEWDGKIETMYSIMFLFRNGVTLTGDYPTTTELPVEEDSYKNGDYFEKEKDNKLKWGIFNVSDNMISREIWANPNGTYLVYKQKIVILNDTTIQFVSSERLDGSETKALDNTYHFKAFSPKPDSTVSFIP